MSIVVQNVTKRYPTQTVVKNVSLEIASGELFVLLGASGSGKSTLLRMIAGLVEVDQGTIWLDDRNVTHLPPQQRETGFVFQNYSLFRHMTVAQNIEFGLTVRHASRAARQQRVQELLTLIGLEGYEQRLPSQLSGGQQQRVALARALAYEPRVLLLDEPFGALDVKIRVQLRQNLREIQQTLGITAILVTHDQEEAFDVADRIGIIEQGQLLESGTPDQLYRRPQHPFTATFLGNANLLSAQRNGTQVYIGQIGMPAPPATEHLHGQAVSLLCRPEEVELALSASAYSGNALGWATVESIAFAGAQQRVSVRLDNATTLQAVVSPGRARQLNLHNGQKVWVSLQDFHLLPQSPAAPVQVN
jgi:sulfate transport system ATP-binding protein